MIFTRIIMSRKIAIFFMLSGFFVVFLPHVLRPLPIERIGVEVMLTGKMDSECNQLLSYLDSSDAYEFDLREGKFLSQKIEEIEKINGLLHESIKNNNAHYPKHLWLGFFAELIAIVLLLFGKAEGVSSIR